jgi:hypothetical protein
VVVIGASASAGFTETEPFGGSNTANLRLSRYLDAALITSHEPVRNLANTLFFIQPDAEASKQINLLAETKPTLVIGLDFLFWFCYGQAASEAERLQHFQRGLTLLDSISCPLIVGDIPDASAAVNGQLSPELTPAHQTRTAANQRLKAWAAKKPRVTVLPLSSFMRAAMANEPITVHGHTVPRGKTRALLQSDNLHPNPAGCAILAVTILDALVHANASLHPGDVHWDPKEVLTLAIRPRPSQP